MLHCDSDTETPVSRPHGLAFSHCYGNPYNWSDRGCREGASIHATEDRIFQYPPGWEISPDTSTGPTTALDTL